MAIRKSYVPSVYPGVLWPAYTVDGDRAYASYPTAEEAKEREAEIAKVKAGQSSAS
ncbi:hypothetical protein [Streptomyces sp. NPDC087525]|uniref:hypothetical protein n=1 Tax=Streptomyces sp. NPDC087525 TaxID=3365793 RepID=UPI00380562FD